MAEAIEVVEEEEEEECSLCPPVGAPTWMATFADLATLLMAFFVLILSFAEMDVASLVERKTRFAVLFRNNDRSSTHFMSKLMDVIAPSPQPARRSITFDRGSGFRECRKLKPEIGK